MNDPFNLLARVTISGAGVGRNLNPEGRRTFLGPYRERTARRNAAAMLRDAAEAGEYLRRLDFELRATLGHRPILLVFGSASPTVKEKFPERWKKRFPAAKVMVDDGHHFPMNDAPDLVANAIQSWWTSVASHQGFL